MTGLTYLKTELKKIKNGKDSFLGIDGGNINSKIWVCGVEFGGELDKMEKYYTKFKNIIKNKPIDTFNLPIPYRTKCPEESENSTYDRRLSLLYQVFFENNTNKEYLKNIDDVLQNKLYNEDSVFFKLNLFPLAKPTVAWKDEIEKKLNVYKGEYYSKYFKNRKMFFKKLIQKFEPKYIVATSTKYYKKEFIEAFYEPQNLNYNWEYLTINGEDFEISTYTDGQLTLIIIPFLGRGGLNSYDDVIFMAKYLKENYLKKELS